MFCALVRDSGRCVRDGARRRKLGRWTRLLTCNATEQRSTVAGIGLVEDRLQVILNSVLGETQLVRKCARVRAESQPFEQLGFTRCKPVAPREERASLRG